MPLANSVTVPINEHWLFEVGVEGDVRARGGIILAPLEAVELGEKREDQPAAHYAAPN